MKTRNQLKAFRKRMHQSFRSFVANVRVSSSSSLNFYGEKLSRAYSHYCKKMLIVTICHVLVNVLIVLLSLYFS